MGFEPGDQGQCQEWAIRQQPGGYRKGGRRRGCQRVKGARHVVTVEGGLTLGAEHTVQYRGDVL